jgi:hypothetical protein
MTVERTAERFSGAESAAAGDGVDRVVPSGQRTAGRLDAHALHVLRGPDTDLRREPALELTRAEPGAAGQVADRVPGRRA